VPNDSDVGKRNVRQNVEPLTFTMAGMQTVPELDESKKQ